MTAVRRNRCDELIDLIDRCLAECDAVPSDPEPTTTTGDRP